MTHDDDVALEALTQQFNSLKLNTLALERSSGYSFPPATNGALQDYTVKTLKRATAFAWSPDTTETVATAAESLVPDTVCSGFATDDLPPAGWWWFEKPIPVRTVLASGETAPVVALLWAKDYNNLDGSHPMFQSESAHEHVKPGIWFSTMVKGEEGEPPVPFPTTAWKWPFGVRLEELQGLLQREYRKVYDTQSPNNAGLEATCHASYFFSAFLIAASTWLRQRIITRAPAQGGRQVKRALRREYALDEIPTVEIIKLRRREVEPTEPSPDAIVRHYRMRFIVHGHFRNQWYAKAGVHAPKWIESYIKGPADTPLKDGARIYSVTR